MILITYNNITAALEEADLVDKLNRCNLYWEYIKDDEIYIQGENFDIELTIRRR